MKKSKRPKKKKEELLVGIGFYRREQYPLLLETAADRDNIEDTYDEWLEALKKGLKTMREGGMNPVKVDVDINELLDYCQANGLENNGKTRAKFFSVLLNQGRWEKFEDSFLSK